MTNSNILVRVYGIHINEQDELLVSDEFVFGKYITKFPGGGLEYGEGTRDCLRREMMEESGQEFKILEHFYTSDFFVPSAFHENMQVLSVYYLMECELPIQFRISRKKFDFEKEKEGSQSFRMISRADFHPESFALPVDRYVAQLILSDYAQRRMK